MKSLTDKYEIQSRATSSWEHGNPIHKGTQGIFRSHGVPYDTSKTSQQISKKDFEYFDYIIGMDESNLADLYQMCPQDQQDKIKRLHLKAFQTHGIQVILKKLTIGFQLVVELG